MKNQFSYYFRKFPLVRAACLALLVFLIFGTIFLITKFPKEKPTITSISPQIGVPGDIMTITGTGFGHIRDTSYVEIGGTSLTNSSYISWSNTQIEVLLPVDIKEGLVFVITANGSSQPSIFANKENIPIAVRQEKKSSLPMIFSETPANASVGQVITIKGDNFGSLRNDSVVYFTPQWMENKNQSPSSQNIEENFIKAFDSDFDYEYWSNTEIRVRVPDSSITGYFFVKTDKGESNRRKINVIYPTGEKKLDAKRTYLVQLAVDVSDIQATSGSLITLRVPRPQPSASQPYIEMTECDPLPVFENYNKSIIHYAKHDSQEPNEKIVFKQNFVIPVYSVTTSINPAKVTQLSEKNKALYSIHLNPDPCVPSDAEEIIALASKITGKETNPYKKAKLIYDYIISNFTFLPEINQDRFPLDALKEQKTDAYDITILFCALARAKGVPAIPISGVLVDANKNVQKHWWAEIYFQGIGWIPVDLSMACGMEYELYKEPENRAAFYFGNMDNQHIAISKGWSDVKPAIANNKTVCLYKTYGLQGIWEESTSDVTSYSSFWADPIVLGIY